MDQIFIKLLSIEVKSPRASKRPQSISQRPGSISKQSEGLYPCEMLSCRCEILCGRFEAWRLPGFFPPCYSMINYYKSILKKLKREQRCHFVKKKFFLEWRFYRSFCFLIKVSYWSELSIGTRRILREKTKRASSTNNHLSPA